MRPASDSDPCRNNSGDALPSTREPGRQRPAVGEYAENREQAGTGLNLVDDDKAAERLQCQHGLAQPRQVPGVLQIEARDLCPIGCEFQREGSLADLARTQECDDRIVLQLTLNSGQVAGSGDQHV